MFLYLTWQLPRVAATVAMPRHALDSALKAVGITADCRADLALALSEACGNAVQHAREGADYRVTVTADQHRCWIEIVDTGIGYVYDPYERPPDPATAVRGRGLALIRACTDAMALDPVEPQGLAVRFSKLLAWEPGAQATLVARDEAVSRENAHSA